MAGEGIVDDAGVIRVTPDLWALTEDFLVREKTGRVTWHVDHGVVQTVEATEFVRRHPRKPLVVTVGRE